MDIGMNDTLPWGQYKGKKIEQIAKEDMPYLVWLRDARAVGDKVKGYEPQIKFFSREVLELINKELASPANKKWSNKYLEWDLDGLFGEDTSGGAMPKKDEILTEIKMQETYEQQWGSF